MSVDWHPESFTRTVMDNAYRRLLEIVVAGEVEAKTNMRLLAGHASSEPGDWPARQSGWFAENITYEKPHMEGTSLVARFGIIPKVPGGESLGYPYWLEVGTPRMLPRPWMTFVLDFLENTFGIRFERSL